MLYSPSSSVMLLTTMAQVLGRVSLISRTHFLVMWEGHMTTPKDFWAPPRL
jgi:hypothetical protein